MIRKAFIMSVNADAEAKYERRHRPIRPKLESVPKTHATHNYSICLDVATHTLFGLRRDRR